MTREAMKQIILKVLEGIAPEADLTQLKPEVSFRDQLDIDSMDFLNFVIAIHKETKVDIPDTDYSRLFVLNDCIDYLLSKIPG
jgi:acyl carrier protein